jgi:ABC-type siderophore export system fused ATPase/permease subunit
VKARSALVYTVLRLLAFLVPFGVLMLFPVFRELYWLAAVFAALIGLSLSLLFLRRPLAEVTAGLAERRSEARTAASDEEIEDAASDSSASMPRSADEGPEQERPVRD